MTDLYRAVDVEKAVEELECVEDLLVEADAMAGSGDLEKALQCLLDAQKSIKVLQQMQRMRNEQKRMQEIVQKMKEAGVTMKVVQLYV
ncbi:hypothetical protein [Rummeliibacillus sp. BSL5]